jgi:hypothetical protein
MQTAVSARASSPSDGGQQTVDSGSTAQAFRLTEGIPSTKGNIYSFIIKKIRLNYAFKNRSTIDKIKIH